MNYRKIQGIVSGYLEDGYALEVIPCIFRVTLVAATENPNKEAISENSKQIMIGLVSFITKLNHLQNSSPQIGFSDVTKEMECLIKEMEDVLHKSLLFIEKESTSLDVLKRINQFVADYNALVQFINENKKA